MAHWTRRQMGLAAASAAGVAAAGLGMPYFARAQSRPRVVIVGGGAGGASAARHIADTARGSIEVTLVEAGERYTTCFFSNHYLGGHRSFESITHGYGRLQSEYGVVKVTARAVAVDRDARAVHLSDGALLAYDRLVLSPGVELIFDSVPGYSPEAALIAPHAWQGGDQALLLKQKFDALEDGQNVIIVPPPNPYRCPPAPYERASIFAHALKSKGFSRSRITILDTKEKFAKQGLFQPGWESHYPGMVEWIGVDMHGGVLEVDAAAGTVATDLDIFEGALLNIIPAQRAGAIAQECGLADAGGYCPVEADSMRSRLDPNIFVIGDSADADDLPKSAYAANSQAQVAAINVLGDLAGTPLEPAHYTNTCWSMIMPGESVMEGGEYAAEDGRIANVRGFISQAGEDAAVRLSNFNDSLAWYDMITADMFG